MIHFKNTAACLGSLILLSGASPLFAEGHAPEGKDVSRKMNVDRYDAAARGINAPMYDYYAAKIKAKTGITKGVCLDVGSGGGHMGLALARITDLEVIFLDISEPALEKAKVHIVEDGLQKRAKTLLADVHQIPLADGSVNLVISRGSIPFWKDPAVALKEIHRVLAPGGMAYVGGGRGTPEIQAQIAAKLKESGVVKLAKQEPKVDDPGAFPARDYGEILRNTGIARHAVLKGDDGMWIMLWK